MEFKLFTRAAFLRPCHLRSGDLRANGSWAFHFTDFTGKIRDTNCGLVAELDIRSSINQAEFCALVQGLESIAARAQAAGPGGAGDSTVDIYSSSLCALSWIRRSSKPKKLSQDLWDRWMNTKAWLEQLHVIVRFQWLSGGSRNRHHRMAGGLAATLIHENPPRHHPFEWLADRAKLTQIAARPLPITSADEADATEPRRPTDYTGDTPRQPERPKATAITLAANTSTVS